MDNVDEVSLLSMNKSVVLAPVPGLDEESG